jgi:hypothetical protein
MFKSIYLYKGGEGKLTAPDVMAIEEARCAVLRSDLQLE